MKRDYHTSPKRHGLAVSPAFHAHCSFERNSHREPQLHATQQHPAYKRARARPISRARALPTNRHEGGSLT